MKKNINLINILSPLAILLLLGVYFIVQNPNNSTKAIWSSKKTKIKSGEQAYMQPDGFIEYYQNISKKIGEKNSSYKKGYRGKALATANTNAVRRAASFQVEFTSRGPGNVGGRTRAIAIDPEDPSHCTWYAGAASGGIWKTTDCGQSWNNISAGLPNLSTNSIAQALSNPDVIYVGTGEVFALNSTFVRGDGIYKSVDRGQTWNLLPATVDNVDFISVNRIAIDPTDENIVVIATNSGIYKSTDGGVSWIQTFNSKSIGSVQDLQVDPTDFQIQYAGVNSAGIYKSMDAGTSWQKSSAGINDGIRFEIAIAPSSPNIVYTSSYVGSTTLLYYSDDSANTWTKAVDNNFNTNFLGAQGWYDNTVEVNPYNPYEVFVGGVNIGKFLIDPNNIGLSDPTFLGLEEENTSFLSFVTFGADFNGGTIDISDGNLSPSQNPVSIEIRWGGNNTQKAHRFVVPSDGGANNDGGAGVPITDYAYQDYVDVPFEVWDIENNRQLMVSFRDQQNDGTFNLNPRDEATDPQLLTAREYLYVHDIAYNSSTPDSEVSSVSGGIQYQNMYYFWPVLSPGKAWSPATFTDAILRIKYGVEPLAFASASAVYDAYGEYGSQNQNSLHPDHHHLTFIKTNEQNEEFMVINGNDGSFGFSEDNGVNFVEREQGYVTSQFYGADKKPGEDKYIGGTQDNGTWISNGAIVDASNSYKFRIGGDGFEVLWHATNTDLVMGSIYNNRIQVSRNGGVSFSNSTTGIVQEDGPFITRLASSNTSPDVVYAVGEQGVYKSTNFGESWEMKVIDFETWGGNSSSSDLEVSLANDNIVWAGAGMLSGSREIFVSKDKGETFEPTNIPDVDPRAFTTGIYTHPMDENTAYVLFSVANQAKILKTEDLGQSWTDISGFGSGAENSNNGFPDVFTHCLLVMPFDNNVIWVGTEIGIFESVDGGGNWSLRTDMPSVSIWSMKVVDDQVVIGTHGRGIWSATISELEFRVSSFEYQGYGDATININLPTQYDKIDVLLDDVLIITENSPSIGLNSFQIKDFYKFEGANLQLNGEIQGKILTSSLRTGSLDRSPEVLNFSSTIDLDRGVYPVVIELENNDPFSKIEVLMNGELIHTDTQQLLPSDEKRVISFDYDQQKRNNVIIRSYLKGYVFERSINELVTASKDDIPSSFKVYPVPANTSITIDATGYRISKYTIYTASGQLVKSLNTNGLSIMDIDISALKQGVYLLQIQDVNGEIRSKRFVKK